MTVGVYFYVGNVIYVGLFYYILQDGTVMQGDGQVFKLAGEGIRWPFETMPLAPREQIST